MCEYVDAGFDMSEVGGGNFICERSERIARAFFFFFFPPTLDWILFTGCIHTILVALIRDSSNDSILRLRDSYFLCTC